MESTVSRVMLARADLMVESAFASVRAVSRAPLITTTISFAFSLAVLKTFCFALSRAMVRVVMDV
ncbi:MAG: hypothetical protein WC740_01985 [Verrucomicrobiia bacterium]